MGDKISPSYRSVPVTGTGGVSANLIIRVSRGRLRLSLEPLFTWEAIMEPVKVDEFIRTLEVARDEAKRSSRDNDTGGSTEPGKRPAKP